MPILRDDTQNNMNTLINVAIVASVLLLLCYAVPYIYNAAIYEEDYNSDEDQTTTTTTTKDTWDIVEEVQSIRKRQKNNINKMSQSSSYGI